MTIRRMWLKFRKAMRWLTGFLPVRVWWTWGPPGGGPWFEKPADAADFIATESALEGNWEVDDITESRVAVVISPKKWSRLRFPGQKVEQGDWGIECILIRRSELEREWSGW